jgi:uncharacterized protein YecE (DUF72 family)
MEVSAMSIQHGQIHIGTSGWSYAHWKDHFYPDDLASSEWLAYYTRQFRSVEINSSFYHLPAESTLHHWHDATPDDFVFAAKASRYITHMKKLTAPQQTLPPLLERLATLGNKLGPVLFQLPPHWHFNPERLATLLDLLGGACRSAFEFRDHSWFNEQCFELLSRHGAALCLYELDGFLSPEKLTADFVYVRLHGPGGAYQGRYDTEALAAWAAACTRWTASGHDVYLYFDNDEQAYAAHNAAQLQALIQEPDNAGSQCRDCGAVQSPRRPAGA